MNMLESFIVIIVFLVTYMLGYNNARTDMLKTACGSKKEMVDWVKI